ncbi:MAG: nucleotidyl transferase AbiEii/AbiGii toxin family protein [bacterium]|nr:nucleotidyl transferase AbiEii/AbiGii toxin family protein [bacterium]
MDFEKVLGIIIKRFDEEKVRYGLIGGFAIGALGISRSTVDLDFLVNKDDLKKIEQVLKAVGYESVFKSENVAQYISPVKIMGEVDFLLAFRGPSLRMLEKTINIDIFDGKYKIKVVRPEDIIGLKLQALVNDPERQEREYADIEAVMKQYTKQLDWMIIEEYFETFNKQDKYSELKRKYYAD